ncbi:hypothetical protein [Mucilaginibacter ginkgonis]|uniref:Outer membrane protein with beta-barrel domain n=1 Tax=Mucilaginibacter ginkgonis TaxID=2682091 RepID=A0A6I4I163_9SPHI|nr:hypothetical protein [Mucilaginibacter ginkgonis]QQL48435.1 hypothetical protein GO620_009540 [Mucilaginibacter ginkgonis]
MSEQLDKELKNRVVDVFDNYNDAFANEGWALLREKFPEKERDKSVFWWYSAAAVLLMFIALFWFTKPTSQPVAHHPSKQLHKIQTYTSLSGADSIKLAGAVTQRHTSHHVSTVTKPTVNHVADRYKDYQNLTASSFKISPYRTKLRSKSEEIPPTIERNIATSLKVNDAQPADAYSGVAVARKVTTDSQATKVALAATEKPLNNIKPADPVLKMMADDKSRQAKTPDINLKNQKGSLVSVSPYAATYFNYAKGSNAQVNVGAGVTTDFKLGKNFKFSTGIAIAQNTLSYENGSVPTHLASAAATYAISADPAAASLSTANTSFLGVNASVNNYRASLLGLDIPVNLKYQISPTKTDAFISAGFSSGTFINETYISTVQFNSFSGSAPSTQTNSTGHFSAFNFARTLNFSFGVGYPVGNNRLIIEPFIKYPLGGQGSQNIQFGASGINLKFGIGNLKK